MTFRTAFSIVTLLVACSALADSREGGAQRGEITVYSTTDTAVFRPLIEDFERSHPDTSIRYEELDAKELYDRFLREAAEGKPRADLLLSSAMDLQVKLVNDGYAERHESENASKLPSWARWRNEAFGVTFEPAVMVFNSQLMRGRRIPQSRAELLEALNRDATFWRGRIGTYDISQSSVGYLLASQDARQSSEFSALVQAFCALDIQTHNNTARLLDQLERGELAMGYNLLGSYASGRVGDGAPLTIVYPRDYTLVISRTAILARNAPHRENAHRLLEYLLSLRGQRILAAQSRLSAIRPEILGPYSGLGLAESQVGLLRPITLGPGLLTYLDQQKQRRMIERWKRAASSADDDRSSMTVE